MKPVLCNYYLTLKCNSRCEFCSIWRDWNGSGLREQSPEEVQRNLEDLKRLGIKLIDFTGGEPLLYLNIIEVLRAAKCLGFYTTITTNCILYERYASQLKNLVDILQFSFESPDKLEHNKVRGVDCYDQVIEGIIISKRIKQKINLMHTVTNENYNKIPDMVKFAQENRTVLALNPRFQYAGEGGLSADAVSMVRKYVARPYVIGDLAYLKLIEDGGNKIDKPICRAVSSALVISPDNYLMLPCFHHSTKKLKIENNLYQLYNSDEVQKVRRLEGRLEFCKGCTIYCYMRSSLYRNPCSRYFFQTVKSSYNYFRERMRSQS